MTDMLHLAFLGGLQVTLGDKPVTGFISNKAPALLAYLAVSGRPHSRVALAGLLWGEVPEERARKSLRMVLSNLRQLRLPCLTITRQEVAFSREHPCWLDVGVFEQKVNQVLQEQDSRLTERSASLLEEAIGLYRGDFLQGLYVRDAPAFEEWVLLERERLRLLALQALHLLVIYYAERRDYAKGIEDATRLLAVEPWQEETHRQLMRLLALSGRHSAALAQYETCRRLLAEELGAAPAEETTALYEEIKASSLEAERVLLEGPPSNLPPQLTPLIGRERELTELGRLLADPAYRLVTVAGPGGVGKTRLALAAAEQVRDRFRQGVWLVPLLEVPPGETGTTIRAEMPSVSSLHDMLATAIARALHFTFPGGGEAKERLISYLRGKKLLLLLDSFEHLLAGADFILEILHSAPQVTVLITSRERLNFRAEYVVWLEGLAVPETVDDPAAATYSAVQLFAERAARSQRGFALDRSNLADVVRTCQLVDGLPLAIELAATQVGRLGCPGIAESIAQDLDFLETAMGDVPERHRSMRAVFAGSWRLLSEREQCLLARASVFRGGFGEEAALAVVDAGPSDLLPLENKSLLSRTAPGRYEMHGLLRQFAAEKLRFAPYLAGFAGADEVSDRHSTYYLDFVARREAVLRTDPRTASAEVRREIENINQAWRWAASRADMAGIRRSAGGLSRFLQLAGLFMYGEATFAVAVDRFTTLLEAADRPRQDVQVLLAGLLIEQARFLDALGEYAPAITTVRRAMDLIETCPAAGAEQTRLQAEGQLLWARIAMAQGDRVPAQERLERAIGLARAARLRGLEAEGLRLLGRAQIEQGLLDEARAHLRQALHMYREVGDRRGEATALNDLGLAYRGHYALLRTYAEQALYIYHEIGDRWGESMAFHSLGMTWSLLGDYGRAGTYFEAARELCREIGDRRGESVAMASLALYYHHQGDDETAWEYGRHALRLSRELEHRVNEGYALTNIGHALMGLGRPEEAARAYRQAVDLQRGLGLSNLAMESLAGSARVALAQGDLPRAQDRVDEILQHLEAGSLEGTDEPFRVYLTCYRVLVANCDPRAAKFLETTHSLLQEQATSIVDEDLRRSFLQNVVAHREIVQLWEERHRSGIAEDGPGPPTDA